jgi:NADPH2 dehydrogenase
MTDPKPQYGYLVKEIRDRHPDFSYIQVIKDYDPVNSAASASNDFIRQIWGNRPLISAGGYGEDPERDSRCGGTGRYHRLFSRVHRECRHPPLMSDSIQTCANYCFAQPDLPCRLRHGVPLEVGDGAKYYTYGTVTRLVTPITRFTSPASTGR